MNLRNFRGEIKKLEERSKEVKVQERINRVEKEFVKKERKEGQELKSKVEAEK